MIDRKAFSVKTEMPMVGGLLASYSLALSLVWSWRFV